MSSSEISQGQTLIPVMLKEGISIYEGWLPESLQESSLQVLQKEQGQCCR